MNEHTSTDTLYVHLNKYNEIIAWMCLSCGSNEGFWIISCGREQSEAFEKRNKISGLFRYKTRGSVEFTSLHFCSRNIIHYKLQN
jgi:hypothetical protein